MSTVIGSDTFTRTAATLGTADVGGAWTETNEGSGAASFATDGTSAGITVASSTQASGHLAGLAPASSEVLTQVWLPAAPTGSGIHVGVTARGVGGNFYRFRLVASPDGSITGRWQRSVGAIDTALTTATTLLSGYTPGQKIWIRAQAIGASPTTLQARAWYSGNTEPASWSHTVTDSTAGFQAAGRPGIYTFATSSSGGATARWDNFTATDLSPTLDGAWGIRTA